MKDPNNPADGTHVVIQNGQRASGPLNAQEAQQEAARRNALNERAGNKVPEGQKATVKQNLFG